jgi:CHAT domain-containing protein
MEAGYLADIGHVRLSPSIQAWRSAQRRASTLAASGSQRNFGALGILGEGLKFVEEEVAAISKSLSSWSVKSKVVQNATLDDLRSSLEGAYLGHLSGHGKMVGVRDFSQSGISLGNDNYASIRELLSLRLTSARIITLSACQTAYIDTGRFSDEFLGPAFALIAAGACAVTAGLWNLNEVASTLLHAKLYELLANDVEPVTAHGEAILWLRTARREGLLELASERLGVTSIPLPIHGDQPFGSPQDWASFAYIGH